MVWYDESVRGCCIHINAELHGYTVPFPLELNVAANIHSA